MKLDELKKKLYKPEIDFEERLKSSKPSNKTQKKINQDWQEEKKVKMSSQKKKKLLIIAISFILIFVSVAGFVIWRGFTSFDKKQVSLEIKGAERVVSGEEVKYTVKYRNSTRLNLENVKLIFHYPENSIPTNQKGLDETIDLPNLLAGQEKEIELTVRIIGLRGEDKKSWAELTYQPAGISSQYTNKSEFESEVISVPLVLDFDIPDKLVSGQSFDFSIRYVNQAEISFEDVQIRLEYPDGFVFESANIDPIEEDKVWSLGRLIAGEQGEISIRANISGEQGDIKSFKSQLGLFKDDEFTPYTEVVDAINISNSPLSITQKINNQDNFVAEPGNVLKYKITYKNTADEGIRNVAITSKLEGSALDLSSLELKGASFDGGTQTLTWNASNIPDLNYLGPGKEGSVNFSVSVKDPLPINSYNDKNFTVINSAKIDSEDIPIGLKDIEITGQSQLITKVVSRLILQSQSYYYDDLIPNSGPIPPKVGQTTSYTIKWRLLNISNDLENVKVVGYLPPHVKWNNKINPGYVDLKYNSQTGQVTWAVGDLPATTGVLLPVREVAFQVSITPSVAQVGSSVELVGQSEVTGKDNFVNQDLTYSADMLDTSDLSDLNIHWRDGIVVE